MTIIQEAAGGEITSVSLELFADPHIALTCLEAVDGADVVQTATGDKATGRCISTGHHPAGSQWDSMNLQGERREVGD